MAGVVPYKITNLWLKFGEVSYSTMINEIKREIMNGNSMV